MIITLTWISIILFSVLIYLYISGSLKEYKVEALILGFFAVFFFVIDYQTSELGQELQKINTITHEHKYCEITLVSQECWTNTSYSINTANNTRLQEYIALRDNQHKMLDIISKLVFGGLIAFLIYTLIRYIKLIGLVK